jgi:acetyltransferase-like isoleucine patch superfamily enzyme
MVSSYVSINASTHGTDRGSFMAAQPFRHGTVDIGDDVWIGAGAVIVLNCWIGEGAVVGSNASVTGRVPAFAIVSGTPSKVERYR